MSVIVDGLMYGAEAIIVPWVQREIEQLQTPFRNPVAVGVMAGGALVGGVVWHDYCGHDINWSGAANSPRWCRPAILRRLFAYPFGQLDCRRITATVTSTNHRTQRLLAGLGFSLEGRLRGAIPDGSDLLVYGLLRTENRWN